MSAPVTVPVLTSTGDVWYGGERAGRVTRIPDTRYWSANPDATDEHTRFGSRAAAVEYLVARVKLGGLRPDHYRRFGTSRATGSLAPMSKEYATWGEAHKDPEQTKRPRAVLACRDVWVDGQPRLLVHHPDRGPVTYEGLPGFRALPPHATVEVRNSWVRA